MQSSLFMDPLKHIHFDVHNFRQLIDLIIKTEFPEPTNKTKKNFSLAPFRLAGRRWRRRAPRSRGRRGRDRRRDAPRRRPVGRSDARRRPAAAPWPRRRLAAPWPSAFQKKKIKQRVETFSFVSGSITFDETEKN